MKIIFDAGKSGWVEYVLDGTKENKRNKELIEIIDGDLELTKTIYESTNYKENYIRGVMAFKGKQDRETMKKVYEEFKENLMIGYENDEYNIAAIIHKDTNNDHIHFCIPKLNLISGKQNHIYYDKSDRYRVNLIRDYLIKKYDLIDPTDIDTNTLEKEQKEITRIEIWRKTHKQKLPSLKRKRSQIKAQQDISNYINELIESKIITNLDDTKQAIKELELNIVNEGFDREKNFHYLTIQDTEGNKLRLKGEVYGNKYYENTRQNTRTKEQEYRRDRESINGNYKEFKDIETELNKANEKHKQYIQKRYRAARVEMVLENNNNFNNFYRGNDNSNNDRQNENTNNNNSRGKSNDISNEQISRNEPGQKIYIHNKGIKNDNTNSTNSTMETTSKNTTRTRGKRIRNVLDKSGARIQRIRGEIQTTGARIKGATMKSKEEIEHFKKEINLVDYAESYGFEINRKKSSRNAILMEKDNNKILIGKQNGHYLYFDINNEKGGSIIDFHKNYIKNNEPFFKTILALRNYKKDNKVIKNPIQETNKEERGAIISLAKLRNLDNENYLKYRYLSNETINQFKVNIFNDDRNNTCFPTFNYYYNDNKFKIERTGLEKKNKDFKQQLGEKGLWGKQIGNKNDLYIFESPIDLMAFYELHKKEGYYISTGGNLNQKQQESLIALNTKINPNSVYLCLDNDEGGDKLENKITPIFSQLQPERLKPLLKDFNEDLILKELPLEQFKTLEKIKEKLPFLSNKYFEEVGKKLIEMNEKREQERQEELKKQEEQERQEKNRWEIRGR